MIEICNFSTGPYKLVEQNLVQFIKKVRAQMVKVASVSVRRLVEFEVSNSVNLKTHNEQKSVNVVDRLDFNLLIKQIQ